MPSSSPDTSLVTALRVHKSQVSYNAQAYTHTFLTLLISTSSINESEKHDRTNPLCCFRLIGGGAAHLAFYLPYFHRR